MIDFSRAQLTHFILHHVGNKGLGEELILSDNIIVFTDDFVKETFLRYFLTPFKLDKYHTFRKKLDVSLRSVGNDCEDIFTDRNTFVNLSQDIATHLYNQSMHPKIMGGPLYICFFKDVVCDGVLVDTIGIFKTEKKETFLKVFQNIDNLEIDCDNGININKLDKGCLVFNTDKENGYKLSIIDTNNKPSECALYWEHDFLDAKIQTNAYYHTDNFMNCSVAFCEEILTEQNNVSKQDQMMMLNTSTSYFKDKDKFNIKDFQKEVLVDPAIITAFKDFQNDFNKRLDLTAVEEFDISATAVKKHHKYMRSVVKLDKNFHVYIHARHDYIERGYDEEKGLKFYKLFYVNEES